MKEFITRAFSGVLYVGLLLLSLYSQNTVILLFFAFGLICLFEFKRLIAFESKAPYILFTLMYLAFSYWTILIPSNTGYEESLLIVMVLSIFVLLLLIKDLFSEKTIPLSTTKDHLLTTFYIGSAFVFLVQISNYKSEFNPVILLGVFVLMWINDTFAYIIGKNFGKQKLFSSISPKKTVEGFLGGLLFACIASYLIASLTETFIFAHWLALSIIVAVFGTLGDLIESKFKRQANVKDSGTIMPGHGGLLDRLDSIIVVAPFFYLYLRLVLYVS